MKYDDYNSVSKMLKSEVKRKPKKVVGLSVDPNLTSEEKRLILNRLAVINK